MLSFAPFGVDVEKTSKKLLKAEVSAARSAAVGGRAGKEPEYGHE